MSPVFSTIWEVPYVPIHQPAGRKSLGALSLPSSRTHEVGISCIRSLLCVTNSHKYAKCSNVAPAAWITVPKVGNLCAPSHPWKQSFFLILSHWDARPHPNSFSLARSCSLCFRDQDLCFLSMWLFSWQEKLQISATYTFNISNSTDLRKSVFKGAMWLY